MSSAKAEWDASRAWLRDIVFASWEYDVWRGVLTKMGEGQVLHGLLSHVVRTSLLRTLTLAAVELARSEGDTLWNLAVHTLSLPWLEAYYLDRLYPTRILRYLLSGRFVPRIIEAVLLPAPCPDHALGYLHDYLPESDVGFTSAFSCTFQRSILPAVVRLLHTCTTAPLLRATLSKDRDEGYPWLLHAVNSGLDLIGSTLIRALGSALGTTLAITLLGRSYANHGGFWGGIASYYWFTLRVHRAAFHVAASHAHSGEEDEGGRSLVDLLFERVLSWGGGATFWRGVTEEEPPEESYLHYAVEGRGEEETYYDALGVEAATEPEVIQKAFRKLALENHPDRLHAKPAEERKACEEKMKKITHAYNNLKDERKRRIYDAYLDDKAAGRPEAMGPRQEERESSNPEDQDQREGGAAGGTVEETESERGTGSVVFATMVGATVLSVGVFLKVASSGLVCFFEVVFSEMQKKKKNSKPIFTTGRVLNGALPIHGAREWRFASVGCVVTVREGGVALWLCSFFIR